MNDQSTDTMLPTIAGAESTDVTLAEHDGLIAATSAQIALHFNKRHRDVLRAIRNLVRQLPDDERERNFAPTLQKVHGPQGAARGEPMYFVSRDGFALLAMGFTGQQALGWKLAYIRAFNLMEARLKAVYVEPLIDDKQFRDGIPIKYKLILREQSRATMKHLIAADNAEEKRNLYWQLKQVNETLGIPTASMKVLVGDEHPPLAGP